MDMKPAPIRLHIGELVVNGVTVGDRAALGDAIRSELTRLLTAHALPAGLTRSRYIPSLDAGAVPVASPHPHALGTSVALAVHGSFRK